MAFLSIQSAPATPASISRQIAILIAKAKQMVSLPAKNPQRVLDAQTHREAARRAVDNLLR